MLPNGGARGFPHEAREVARMVSRGELGAEEVVAGSLAAIEGRDREVGAFLAVDREGALAQARRWDGARGRGELLPPLAGVPVAVKDNICTRELATTCGSRMLEGFRPSYDATAVARLRRAGAVVVGKTNLDEFGMGSSTENSAFGVTRNPWDTSRVAGGSSGGSAAAVAAGMVPLALGSDTGGSVRQPAALSGVVGLKPTYGRISRWGLVAYASSLEQIGPLATTVTDCALATQLMAGWDERDSTSAAGDVPPYVEQLAPPKSLRLGLPREYFDEGLDDEVEGLVREALELLAELGAELVDVSLPHTPFAVASYYLVATAEASSNLARYDGVRFGDRRSGPSELAEMYGAARRAGFGAEVKRRVMLGTYALSAGYYEAYYLKAQKVRSLVAEDFRRAFARCDCLVTPTTPSPAFALGEKLDDPLTMYLSDVYTCPANLSGCPALSVPCGRSRRGLPVGIQFVGPPFAEGLLFRVGKMLEEARGEGMSAGKE